ncbi:MAG: ABC transporter permease subunit [Myxococcales bacterium]|nr:MAG: ABC transporter permease subunit [Myxococcales bacterium]
MRAVFRARLAQLLLGTWLVLGLYGLLVVNAHPLLVGLGHDLLALVAVLLIALMVGVPLGALAGSGPRWLDATLSFVTDWIAAVPVVLLLAFVRPSGVSHFGGLLVLGLLRALEVGWVVRSALLRAARVDTTWAARSLGYMPLAIFVRQRLPAAARPALAHLALTPVWTFLLDGIGIAAGLGAASSARSLGAFVVSTGGSGPAALGVLAVLSATWALHRLGEHYGLRLARK